MKQSDRISYEKPTLVKYGFFGVAAGAGTSAPEDNPDPECSGTGFDD